MKDHPPTIEDPKLPKQLLKHKLYLHRSHRFALYGIWQRFFILYSTG